MIFSADPKACPNSDYSPVNGQMSMSNDVYSYSCKPGYTLDGPDSRTCNTVDGTWNPASEPTCKGIAIYYLLTLSEKAVHLDCLSVRF